MLKKRIAMGILTGLLACSFIAGCGGGDKGTSEPLKPKPVAEDLRDLPNKDLKIGSKTYKLYTLKNNANQRLNNTYSSGMFVAVAGRDMIFANVKGKLVQMKWEKDGVRMINDNAATINTSAKLAADDKGVFYINKKLRLAYFDGTTGREDIAWNRMKNLALVQNGAAPDKALIWSTTDPVQKVELRNGYKVGKDLGVVRPSYRDRMNADDKDKINMVQSLMTDKHGDIFVGGFARVSGNDVGLVAVYDNNGKQKRVIGKEKRDQTNAMLTVSDIAVTDDYLIVSDCTPSKYNLMVYKKNTGSFVQRIEFKELTDNKDATMIGSTVNLANMPDNRVFVVLSRDKRNVDDEFFILQL